MWPWSLVRAVVVIVVMAVRADVNAHVGVDVGRDCGRGGGVRRGCSAVHRSQIQALDGVHVIQGDITQAKTLLAVKQALGGEYADIVLCDGAPEVTGMHGLDQYLQQQLILAALQFAVQVLWGPGRWRRTCIHRPSSWLGLDSLWEGKPCGICGCGSGGGWAWGRLACGGGGGGGA